MDENTPTKIENKSRWSFKIVLYWILAFVITAGSAYYQRLTGPTYPESGAASFQGKEIKYKFDRSCDTSKLINVKLENIDSGIKGYIEYRRYDTKDDKTLVEMKYENGTLTGEFPAEKDKVYKTPAQKFEYKVLVLKEDQKTEIPSHPVVLRYKGDVPMIVLIIHIILIFTAMLVSTRAGFEFFNKEPNFKKFALWSLGFITVGGMILGPVVQKYAFGELWTGIPFGIDLTDNKTLIAWIIWIATTIQVYRGKNPGKWILIASIVTLIIFSIPHSVMSGNTPAN